MSDLRELRDTVERVFKQVCRLSAENNNLARLQGDFGDIFGRLVWAAAEQEALSRAPQDIERAKRHIADMQEKTWYHRKGSSVEYLKDRLVEVTCKFACDGRYYDDLKKIIDACRDYERALSASPDPEGEWQWVPNTHVVAPKEATQEMIEAGYKSFNQYESYHYIDSIGYGSYPAMIAARPPVPKKGERV